MAKIVCEKCGTEYKFEAAKDFEFCPACKTPLIDKADGFCHEETPAKNKTYYYYNTGTLTETLYDHIKPLYIFKATDAEDAKRQLKEVCPNSPLLKSKPSREIRCPRCASKEYTLVSKGYSIFTGFLGSGRVKRVCNYCKKEF